MTEIKPFSIKYYL